MSGRRPGGLTATGGGPSSFSEYSGASESAAESLAGGEEQAGSWPRFLRELPGVLALSVVLAVLLKTFLIQAFFIPSPSMVPTLAVDDRVLVSKIAYSFGGPQRGDVIVFDSPYIADRPESFLQKAARSIREAFGVQTANIEDLIKRVVAVGGDRLEIRGNRLLVNGLPIDEPYLESGAAMRDEAPFYIPDGHVWVMGDNRNNSQDSRRFGSIPAEDVVGRAFVRIWPPSRWAGL